MNNTNNEHVLIEYLDIRFDNLEKLMIMSLMSDMTNELDKSKNSKIKVNSEIMNLIKEMGFIFSKTEVFGDKIALYIYSDNTIRINKIRQIKKCITEKYNNCILVFMLEKVNGNRRKKFLEEKISYLVNGEELFISK